MSGILTSTQANGSAVTGHLCPKTDVVASKWIAIATITAVFGHTSPNEPSWRHKMLESADLARLPSDRSRKWEIPVNPGPIDGVYGSQTRRAVNAYQKKAGLPTGALTIRTLNSLGVKLGSAA